MKDQEEPIYYSSEIKKILQGLSNVYYSKPWYSRWLYKPWLDAIVTMDLIFCQKIRKEETVEDLFGLNE